MEQFDVDKTFEIILIKIENKEIKTTHELRLFLENIEEKYHIKTLHLLVAFKEWLAEKDIQLLTENGIVELQKN